MVIVITSGSLTPVLVFAANFNALVIHKMAGNKAKRATNWSEDEVRNLLEIWKEPQVAEQIASKTRCKTNCWQEIASRLSDLGYPERQPQQIHNKIKDLRRTFKIVHDEASKSGAGADAIRQFPYYYLMVDIMGNRPSITAPAGTVGESSTDPQSSTPRPRPNQGSDEVTTNPSERRRCTSSSSARNSSTSSARNTSTNQLPISGKTNSSERRQFSCGSSARNTSTSSSTSNTSSNQSRIFGLEDWYEDSQEDFGDIESSEDLDDDVEDTEDIVEDSQVGPAELRLPENDVQVDAVDVQEDQVGEGTETPEPARGKKRQRLSVKDRTVDALAKKMKEVTAASHKKFMAAEERRRKENLEQREEDRKSIEGLLSVVKQGIEERARERAEERAERAEERRASERRFEALLAVFSRNQNNTSYQANSQRAGHSYNYNYSNSNNSAPMPTNHANSSQPVPFQPFRPERFQL